MRLRARSRPCLVIAVLLACLGLVQPAVAASQQAQPISIAPGWVGSTPIGHWEMQSSTRVQQGGQVVSEPGYSMGKWYHVGAHVTVMAGLLENGQYPDAFYGLNLQRANPHHFQIPWWYRTTFKLPADDKGARTFIKINGIIPAADLWLDGKQVANRGIIAGAYTTHTFDVTSLVHSGLNALAFKVFPASSERDLTLGWIDWNPAPPDHNMGIWRNVEIVRTGPVSIRDLHVLSRLDLPGMQHADLTLKAQLVNNTALPEDVVVRGQVAGVVLDRRVRVAPHALVALVFDSRNTPGLRLDHPKVWWPAGMGAHPLYDATLAASVGDTLSDHARTTFGIRDVTSQLTPQGYRQFVINGQPLLIRGAGWAPDMFLRDQPERLVETFRYIRNMGLNAIRAEGKLERPDFYRLADRNGIMVLAGWECCDKWEAWAKTGGEPWNDADLKIAGESMASEARRLRDHPSVIAFLIGSDNAPPPAVAQAYVDALHAADWPDPIVSAASDQKTMVAGPSGMKMSGPYAWVPPDYWYADKAGGAFGFNSETSAGVDMPRLATLESMLTPRALDALWQDPNVRQYHASPMWSPFSSLKRFDTALAHRYGPAKSLRDYVEKAQLANYEAVRAQFEAYDAHMDAAKPATGVIYWMLDNAWPSLHWHLISHDMNPAGAYFGAKKANEPIHIQYSYDDRAVMAINHTLQPAQDLDARIRVHDLDGKLRYSRELTHINLPANHATRVATIPALTDLSGTYFVELELSTPDQRLVSRNVYWLSSQPDALQWADSKWDVTPVSRYADFTALQQLPPATLVASACTRQQGNHDATTITLTAAPASKAVALFLHASMRQSTTGKPVLPVEWDDNDVTLWPGESVVLTAQYVLAGEAPPVARVAGWNVGTREIAGSACQQPVRLK
ncbi:MAG: glycosyl hydrolase 2 galactose-binding domain-containing protein [Rhodanobacteraceae bacterium]